MQRIPILGVPIDCISQHEAIRRIEGFLRSEGKFHVATPNPEMLVETRKNGEFRKVLQNTALNLPDGIGLVWALRLRRVARGSAQDRLPGIHRVTGTDTMITLCSTTTERACPSEALKERRRVFLLGAAPGVAEKAAAVLRRRNPNIVVAGTFFGSPRPEDEDEIVQRINASSPTLLFVAYGAPAQDLWIARNLKRLETVKVAMGVGGAFDLIAGKQKRAPAPLRTLGLEWLWRLVREPKRVKRIWNAVVVFPLLVLFAKTSEGRPRGAPLHTPVPFPISCFRDSPSGVSTSPSQQPSAPVSHSP